MRACIASLLEQPIDDVPDFSALRDDDDSLLPNWWIEMQAFAKRFGYQVLEIRLQGKLPWMPIPDDVLCIFIGPKQNRGNGASNMHAIIGRCKNTQFYPVFDPFSEEANPCDAFIQNKVYALLFLVPMNPAKLQVVVEETKIIADRSDGKIITLS